jgi:CRISPR/Cas system-associated endonuclease Cas3-HD
MAYNLFTDKHNKFNCNIEIEGTSLAKSKVRLVIETDEMSYMFNGKIENTGICEVNIPKTKNFLSENTKGVMRLEVIADDVYFEPWSSDFNVKTTKKVNIVVSEQIEDEKPKLKVEVIQPKEDTKVVNENKVKEQKQKISSNVILTKKDILKLFK